MTLNEIASIIDSNVRTGLKGVANFSYPLNMLEREAVVERNRIIDNKHNKPGFNTEGFTQSINCIKVDKKALSKCPSVIAAIDEPILHFELPMIELNMLEDSIDYIGPSVRNGVRGWKVYFDEKFSLHKHKPASCKLPYIYIDPTSTGAGSVDGFVFNFSGNLKYLSYRGILTNPEDAELFQCHGPLEHFPAPDWCVEEIIRRITNKYIQHYRQFHAPTQPNTQTDQVS